MRKVIIESPFAGRGGNRLSRWIDRWQNKRYARAALKDSLLRGEAPIASHLLYTQVLDDSKRVERAMGIEAGLAWRPVADVTVFYIDRGMSPGMNAARIKAMQAGARIAFRSLDPIMQDHLYAETDVKIWTLSEEKPGGAPRAVPPRRRPF